MKQSRLFFALALTCAMIPARAAEVKHNYDLINVLWKLSFSMAKGTIAGEATNTVTLTEDSNTVELSCSELKVSRVTVNGAAAVFTNQDDVLTVKLPSPGKAGQTFNVRAIYTGSPVNGFYFVPASRAFPAHTGMLYTQGEGEDNHYWLPTYDKPDDKTTTECYVTVPKTWTAISNGKLIDVKPVAAGRVFHWKMNQPYSTYLISLVAGEYTQVRDHWRDIPVDFYVPPGLEAEGAASFGNTPKMIDLYSKLTGVDYPYDKFAQETVADFMYGGMENVTCVTQTIRTLHAAGTEPVNDSTYLVAHELAHHWFGDLITCQTWEHTWLNEGFATTLPMFWNRATRGEEAYDLDRYRNFEGAIDTIGSRGRKAIDAAVGSVPTVTMGSAYDGGSSRIMVLMHKLGEESFWKGINAFLEAYKFQPATTQNFFDVMSKSTGTDLSAFASQWFHTVATPSLTASISGNNLIVSQLQPYYTLDLPVWVLGTVDTTPENPQKSWTWAKTAIHIEGAVSTLSLSNLANDPHFSVHGDVSHAAFLIDPEVWTPMELKYNAQFSPAQVAGLYMNAPNAAQKARIIARLLDTIPVDDRVRLGRRETSAPLLQMIAGHIGPEGEEFLLELSRNQDQRIVNAAVLALGGLKQDDAASTRLHQIAEKDPNETVREHATQALLNWTTEPDFASGVWKMRAFDDGYRKMALEWWGSHAPDMARANCLAILDHPDSEPLRITAIQVLGRLKDRPGERAVYDALVAVAQETSYGARGAAIASLAQLGNKDAIPVLAPMTKHAPGGIRGAASAAIAKLSQGT